MQITQNTVKQNYLVQSPLGINLLSRV